jgi:hypothetical protein
MGRSEQTNVDQILYVKSIRVCVFYFTNLG